MLWLCLRYGLWLTAVAAAVPAGAVTYGIYEPRALAMGGASVAVARPQQAQFYNPALLAFHAERAENSRSGRLWLPVISGQTSDAALRIVETTEDDLDSAITSAIAAFNAQPSAANAAAARALAADLDELLEVLADGGFDTEAFAGLAVVEPDREGGGAFYLGVRVVAGARADIAASDRERLDQYRQTFDYLIEGSSGEPPYPELFDGQGNLQDPTRNLESTVSGRGLAVIEWGVSAARLFHLGGLPVSFGITPKLMEVRAYQELDQLVDGGVQNFADAPSNLTGNLDLGTAVAFGNGLRAGLAVKDMVEQDFETGDGQQVTLRPRVRAGLAYSRLLPSLGSLSLGADVDLLENQPIGFEGPRRELALGAELQPQEWLAVRLGYRHDLAQSEAMAVSGGIGLRFGPCLLDIAYSEAASFEGASLQFGFAF